MTRVSTAEMYDDKDVITQICKLKDGLNSALGGIIADIDIVNDELVIDWADGESIALPLPSPTGISSIAGSVAGGNLTMTIYMTDGSSHAFTCPLTGFVTLDTEQTLAAKKIFSVSPEIPVIPATPTGAVNSVYVNDTTPGINDIFHKSGNERAVGVKSIATIKDCNINFYPIMAGGPSIEYYKICSFPANGEFDKYWMDIRSINFGPTVNECYVEKDGSNAYSLHVDSYGTNAQDTQLTDVKIGRNADGTADLLLRRSVAYEIFALMDIKASKYDGTLIDIASLTFFYNQSVDPASYDSVVDAVPLYTYHNGSAI